MGPCPLPSVASDITTAHKHADITAHWTVIRGSPKETEANPNEYTEFIDVFSPSHCRDVSQIISFADWGEEYQHQCHLTHFICFNACLAIQIK
jgi:hypothetical protein